MKHTTFLVILIASLIMIHPACDSSSENVPRDGSDRPPDALQPYQHAGLWDWVAPILEGGWCGPASVYQIMAFYGDHNQSYDYRIVVDYMFYAWADGVMTVPDIRPDNPVLISDTDFGLFLQPDGTGSSWAMLERVGRLYHSRNLNDRLYDLCDCTGHTEPEHVGVRRRRLSRLCEDYLARDIPVIIHLDSGISGYGHYVTLVGCDPEAGRVFYVDALTHDQGVHTVTEEAFLSEAFYQSGLYYSARWDGEWMAFWHRGEAIPCTPCAEAENP
ncbi:hypothetical protein JCM14469_32500 [Desulfatiferula olefinivorans]